MNIRSNGEFTEETTDEIVERIYMAQQQKGFLCLWLFCCCCYFSFPISPRPSLCYVSLGSPCLFYPFMWFIAELAPVFYSQTLEIRGTATDNAEEWKECNY